MELIEYFGDRSDPRSKISIERYDDEIVIDCRGLDEMDDPPDVEVDGDGDETIGLESVPPVEEFDVEDVRPNRYNVFGEIDTQPLSPVYEQMIRERGYLPSLPPVRERDDGTYDLLDGQRRIDIAREVGVERVAVHVADLDDWEYTKAWVKSHFTPAGVDPSEVDVGYSEDEQRAALDRLRADWDEERLKRIEQLRYAIEERGL